MLMQLMFEFEKFMCLEIRIHDDEGAEECGVEWRETSCFRKHVNNISNSVDALKFN